jgi:hypothetical protein
MKHLNDRRGGQTVRVSAMLQPRTGSMTRRSRPRRLSPVRQSTRGVPSGAPARDAVAGPRQLAQPSPAEPLAAASRPGRRGSRATRDLAEVRAQLARWRQPTPRGRCVSDGSHARRGPIHLGRMPALREARRGRAHRSGSLWPEVVQRVNGTRRRGGQAAFVRVTDSAQPSSHIAALLTDEAISLETQGPAISFGGSTLPGPTRGRASQPHGPSAWSAARRWSDARMLRHPPQAAVISPAVLEARPCSEATGPRRAAPPFRGGDNRRARS